MPSRSAARSLPSQSSRVCGRALYECEIRLDWCRCPVLLLIASRHAQRSSRLPTFAVVHRRDRAQAPRLTATTCSSFVTLRRVEHYPGGVQESSRVRRTEYCMHISEHVTFRACRGTSSPVPSAELPADCARPVIARSSRDLPSARHSSPSLSILKTSRPVDPVVAVQSLCASRACLRESQAPSRLIYDAHQSGHSRGKTESSLRYSSPRASRASRRASPDKISVPAAASRAPSAVPATSPAPEALPTRHLRARPSRVARYAE
ncbi:hypothetical protein OH76DRAFT_376270 [Lentinus brumalis]|uniref:Uncharacterized protein n=1 Tax=Lentinus brumalis TaxID=2498619 RepID=A0A371CIZ5_9APHY|nr:hypothetical protein OH76DRAFT_376270 [Polyporus brumalis]